MIKRLHRVQRNSDDMITKVHKVEFWRQFRRISHVSRIRLTRPFAFDCSLAPHKWHWDCNTSGPTEDIYVKEHIICSSFLKAKLTLRETIQPIHQYTKHVEWKNMTVWLVKRTISLSLNVQTCTHCCGLDPLQVKQSSFCCLLIGCAESTTSCNDEEERHLNLHNLELQGELRCLEVHSALTGREIRQVLSWLPLANISFSPFFFQANVSSPNEWYLLDSHIRSAYSILVAFVSCRNPGTPSAIQMSQDNAKSGVPQLRTVGGGVSGYGVVQRQNLRIVQGVIYWRLH